jgi:hypothetical protein
VLLLSIFSLKLSSDTYNEVICVCCSEAGSVVASSDESMVSADSQQKSSVNITNEELQYFMEVLGENGNGDELAWEEVVEKKSDTVAYSAKRRDPKVRKTPFVFSCLCPLCNQYQML